MEKLHNFRSFKIFILQDFDKFFIPLFHFLNNIIFAGCTFKAKHFISALLQKQSGSWNAVLYYLAAALVMAGIINIVTTKVFPVTSHSCKDWTSSNNLNNLLYSHINIILSSNILLVFNTKTIETKFIVFAIDKGNLK